MPSATPILLRRSKHGRFKRVQETELTTAVAATVERGHKLTLQEAALFNAKNPILLRNRKLKRFSTGTERLNATLIKKYRDVNGQKAELNEEGILKLLDAILLAERFNILHIDELPLARTSRPMTFPTFSTKYVAGLRRLWYLKYKGKVEFPRSLEFAIGERKQDASECLPPSNITVAVGWIESAFLIEALPQGANDFFDHAFIIAGNSEVAKRIGVWDGLVYGDIVSIRRLHDPTLIKVILQGGSSKRQLVASVNAINLTGTLENNGVKVNGSVFYMNERLKWNHNVTLIDEKNCTLLQKMELPQYEYLKTTPIYLNGSVKDVSRMFKSAQDNTTLSQSTPLRPHGARKAFYTECQMAMRSGTMSAANKDAVQMSMGHSDGSQRGRVVYMRESLDTRTNFAALWSPLESIRKAGVHEHFTKDLKSRLDLTYDPEHRYLPDKKNLEILYTIVREVLRANNSRTQSKENEAERVSSTVNKILSRFGHVAYPKVAALLYDYQLIDYVKSCLVTTFSKKMTRVQMVAYIQKRLIHLM